MITHDMHASLTQQPHVTPSAVRLTAHARRKTYFTCTPHHPVFSNTRLPLFPSLPLKCLNKSHSPLPKPSPPTAASRNARASSLSPVPSAAAACPPSCSIPISTAASRPVAVSHLQQSPPCNPQPRSQRNPLRPPPHHPLRLRLRLRQPLGPNRPPHHPLSSPSPI